MAGVPNGVPGNRPCLLLWGLLRNRAKLFETVLQSLLFALVIVACGENEGPDHSLEALVSSLKEGNHDAVLRLTTKQNTETAAGILFEDVVLVKAVTHHLSATVIEQRLDGSEARLRVRVTNASLPRVMAEVIAAGTPL